MDTKFDYSGKELGKYLLLRKLGNGSFGAVYKALDRVLNVEKAIKILEVSDPTEACKLFNEAAIPYECKHNNVIKINSGELIQFNSKVVFVVDMELASGPSLEGLLKDKFVPVCDSVRYIKDILFAVEFSHLKRIIHRDIKPANILLDNGVPKLSDFGLSTALGDLAIPSVWYITHAAPEIFSNKSIATVETDIFALGMTMCRMVNNISDWRTFTQSIPQAKELIREGKLINQIKFEPYVPRRIQAIIKRACHVSPEKRYRSAADMRNDLERIRLLYNWSMVDDEFWEGTCSGQPDKEIYLRKKRNAIDVLVKNNKRKSSQDSREFKDMTEAKDYLFEYIRKTTVS